MAAGSSGAALSCLSGWALGDELVGLAEIDEGRHIVRFCGRDLGVIGRDFRFHPFAPLTSAAALSGGNGVGKGSRNSVRDDASLKCQVCPRSNSGSSSRRLKADIGHPARWANS